jgi:hypothetical protein
MESIEQYGSRLATSALSLPDHISEEVLVYRFIEGLPQRLTTQALLVSFSYDEVCS